MKKTKYTSSRFLLSFLLGAQLSHAAVVFDSGNGASAVASAGLSWSHTVTTNNDRILMVAISFEESATIPVPGPTVVTFGSQTFTQLLSVTATGGGFDNQVSIWYLNNPLSGTGLITVSGVVLNPTGNDVRGSSASFSGAANTPTQFGTFNTNATAQSVTFTGVAAGSAVYSAVNYSASGTGRASGDLTFPTGGSFGGGQSAHGAGYALSPLGGTVTTGFTGTSARNPMGAVVIAPIPEASSMALGLLGSLGLLRRRRSN